MRRRGEEETERRKDLKAEGKARGSEGEFFLKNKREWCKRNKGFKEMSRNWAESEACRG